MQQVIPQPQASFETEVVRLSDLRRPGDKVGEAEFEWAGILAPAGKVEAAEDALLRAVRLQPQLHVQIADGTPFAILPAVNEIWHFGHVNTPGCTCAQDELARHRRAMRIRGGRQ